jgi:hypothetical protein
MPDYAQHIYSQFNDPVAQQELQEMSPSGVDWVARTRQTLDLLVPQLGSAAREVATRIPERLNSMVELIKDIRRGELLVGTHADQRIAEWYSSLSNNACLASRIIAQIESQQVSAEIQRYLLASTSLGAHTHPNGNSIYPDLIVSGHDYSMLPQQNRRTPVEGPCLRGTRPSNVPDGCEIKTNRGNRVHVDAHGAHSGLHFGVTWDRTDGIVAITGVWAAYVRIADHRESGRNVAVTTVKHSFGHELFVSLL